MKRLRTSFTHFVREKVLQGLNKTWPEPADVALDQLVSDTISSYSGYVEYQEEHHSEENHSQGNLYNQGPMGYGDPPVGPGTEPYKSFLSNKTYNLKASDVGMFTGKPGLTPSLTLKDINFSSVGITFATGQAKQYRYGSSSQIDHPIAAGKHSLVEITGLDDDQGATYDADPSAAGATNNTIKFIYEATDVDAKTYNLYVERDGNTVSTVANFVHYTDSYGRLFPVHFSLNATGDYEFRVDTQVITGNITTFTGAGGSNLRPATGGVLEVKISGLTPHQSFTNDPFGMTCPISRLTNVAVNDGNNTDGMEDTGLPPFITGVSVSPIRRHEAHTDPAWEFPKLVTDSQDKWTSFSENNPTVPYGLDAVMDSQMFDTRGVATSALSADLDIYIEKSAVMDRLASAIAGEDVEAINIKANNAAVFNNSELAVQIKDTDLGMWETCWTPFPGLDDNPEGDSHVSFFYRPTGTCNETLTGMNVNDFNSDFLIKLRAQNPT